MGKDEGVYKRHVFRWSKQARELVKEHKEGIKRSQGHSEADHRALVTKLAEVSGNPRDACLRFLRLLGVDRRRAYREWTKPEQQRLLDLVTTMPVTEAAKTLHRPPGSVRAMLYRLGIGGTNGREWFTKFSLSRALHTRPEEIQKWIDRGWLKARAIDSSGTKTRVIYSDDFCNFVKQHGREAVSRRLNHEALWFVQNYVFPPSHAELLDVRGTYTKHSKLADTAEHDEGDSEVES